MIIAVDFDGTIVEHQFPEIGKLIDNAADVLRKWKKEGHQLILWTCRNDVDPANNGRKPLSEAAMFLALNGIHFDAINVNVPGLGFDPFPKVYADLYLDDRTLGIVDWKLFDIAVNCMEKGISLKYIISVYGSEKETERAVKSLVHGRQ